MPSIPQAKIDRLRLRHAELARDLADPGASADRFGKLSKEYAELTPVVEAADALTRLVRELEEAEALLNDPSLDAEMKAMARDEVEAIKDQLPEAERQLQIMLLPRDVADEKSAILEIRAGTGGDEAALFAGDLFRMYSRYAEERGWKVELISANQSDVGGYKEVVASITGQGVFARLKFESGVHRVQRVPATESGGRIHTSAATVAVLPEAEEVDVHIDEKDLRIDVFRSSGPGGQSVNTTYSAVRMTHLPTGITVNMQDEKSQIQNRAAALRVLKSRLLAMKHEQEAAEAADMRHSQVRSLDRSERIRTYNFPENRIVDHRTNYKAYNLDAVLDGDLQAVIDSDIQADEADRLANQK